MLLKRRILEGIADGSITLAFRRWRRPTVRAGGTLFTVVGVLAIDAVEPVDPAAVTDAEAAAAGHASLAALRAELAARGDGTVYRIRLRLAGADPRLALRRRDRLDAGEVAALNAALDRLDGAAPWSRAALDLIAAFPGRPAAELAATLGRDRARFKTGIRRLKALGLTESLSVGYRLSPRGEALRRASPLPRPAPASYLSRDPGETR